MYPSNIKDHKKEKNHQHNTNRELNLEYVRGMWGKVKHYCSLLSSAQGAAAPTQRADEGWFLRVGTHPPDHPQVEEASLPVLMDSQEGKRLPSFSLGCGAIVLTNTRLLSCCKGNLQQYQYRIVPSVKESIYLTLPSL